MSKLQQMFRYEASAVRLVDGSFVQLLKDATGRWALTGLPEEYGGPGFRCVTLYSLENGRYLFVEYRCCEAQDVLVDGHPWRIYDSLRPPRAEYVEPPAALQFLVGGQFAIPEPLQHLLDTKPATTKTTEPKPSPAPRSLEYWRGKGYVGVVQKQFAHEVKVHGLVKELIASAIKSVQSLRNWKNKNPNAHGNRFLDRALGIFSSQLFALYQVDIEAWRGPKDKIPPATVGIIELQWPYGGDEMRKAVERLQYIVEPSLAALRAPLPDTSTAEEQRLARESLVTALPEIEQLICTLRDELDELESGKKLNELQERKKPVKVPAKNAFRAYWLWRLTREKQEKIATALTTFYGITADQGMVSRWIAQVSDWLDAGNLLPDASQMPLPQLRSMDPQILDMGPNLEGRSPRQRRRRHND